MVQKGVMNHDGHETRYRIRRLTQWVLEPVKVIGHRILRNSSWPAVTCPHRKTGHMTAPLRPDHAPTSPCLSATYASDPKIAPRSASTPIDCDPAWKSDPLCRQPLSRENPYMNGFNALATNR